MSLWGLAASADSNSSGAMYSGVPTTVAASVTWPAWRYHLASPKSSTLTTSD